MSEFIPLSVPNLKGNELKYVTDAIESEWVSTGGAYINKFEEAIAEYVKVEGAVACQSGTAGLHLALMLSGVEAGDEVIVPTLTFIAAVNPVKYVSAEPIFMDCDKEFCIDAGKLESFCKHECTLTDNGLVNNKTNRLVKAIVAVHVFGNIAKMERIMTIANQYKLKVIEDATEALGSYYTEGKYAGYYAGTIGDFGVYSFNGNKIITTGGGGMLVAKKPEDLKMAKYLSTQAKDDELNFIHHHIGYNYRMTNVQAAIGLAQLEQLNQFIETKKNNYELYVQLINSIDGLKVLPYNTEIRPNYWFYPLLVENTEDVSVRALIQELDKGSIQTRPIWGLIHEQKPYVNCETYEVEQALYYRDHIINIPCSSNLTQENVSKVVDTLKAIVKRGK